MKTIFFWILLLAAFVGCVESAKAQNPPAGAIRSGTTQVQNSTNGDCLYTNGAVLGHKACSSGGTPAAPSGSIQFNDSGAFGGSSTLEFNTSTGTLSLLPISVGATFSSAYPGTPSSFESISTYDSSTSGTVGFATEAIATINSGSTISTFTNFIANAQTNTNSDMTSFTGANIQAFDNRASGTLTTLTGLSLDADSGGTATSTVVLNIVAENDTGQGGTNRIGIQIGNQVGATNNFVIKAGTGKVEFDDLKTTGAATGKKVVCVDTATGILYASSAANNCAN